MYLLKIDQDQMKKLYYLREYLKETGLKDTIAGLVREAITHYLVNKEAEIKNGNEVVEKRELALDKLERQYVRKKMAIAKKRINPEKLKLMEKLETETPILVDENRFAELEKGINERNRALNKKLY